MKITKGKILAYSIIALLSLFLINTPVKPNGDFKFLQTSYLEILKKIAEENKPQPADLAIENVTLRKIGDPTTTFPYYKYYANVIIKNYGGDLKNAKVVISGGDDQKYTFIKISKSGFSLASGKSYILDRHDVIFDGNYNGGNITLKVDVKDREELNQANNSFTVSVFEAPAKLESIGIEKINEDDSLGITFNPINTALNTDTFEIVSTELANFKEEDLKYGEIFDENKIYGYHRIKNSEDVVQDDKWRKEAKSRDDVNTIKFSEDLFNDESSHYFYIRAINPKNGYYAVSNIIKLDDQKELDRAEFAKLFLDYADIQASNKGESFYKDVSNDAWYSPYIKTLYNLGLVSSGSDYYYPDKTINRAEALRVVLDYFDVDLAVNESAVIVDDVDEDNTLHPYIKAFYASGKGGSIGNSFHPDFPATKQFLRYLIYAYN